jgi:FtsP/CotA-like multicopper oxidase with cupredoxin domain
MNLRQLRGLVSHSVVPTRDLSATPPLRKRFAARWLWPFAPVFALVVSQSAAHAAIPCLPLGLPLVKIPEIRSENGIMRGTMLLGDEQQRLVFRTPGSAPGDPTAQYECQPQRVRVFRAVGGGYPVGAKDAASQNDIAANEDRSADPVPGPVLRARAGDIIQLTFVNQIDPNRFGASIDTSKLKPGQSAFGCDVSNPGNPAQGYPILGGDKFPDCFHGSSTGNIHFHGTHTNPIGTGDNVYLEIRPSPRDAQNNPTITPANANAQFRDFFQACEARLRSQPLAQWPTTWSDAPQLAAWTAEQKQLLKRYQDDTGQNLWEEDQKQIDLNQWPQNYIGAYPYCFRLADYTAQTWPSPGSGPIMGQAAGTHWYHAHKHGSTAINVANGMTGVFIIEGQYDDDLNAFYGEVDGQPWTRTQPILVINQLGVSPNLLRPGSPGGQDKGPDFSVNGRVQPVIDMAPGEVQMWRIANTSGRSGAFFYGPERGFGMEWRQLAQDGVQFDNTNYQSSRNRNPQFLLAAGNRADLLVKAPQAGIFPVMVRHDVDPSDLAKAVPVVLFYVRVRSDVPAAAGNRTKFIPNAPRFPSFLADISDAEVGGATNDNRTLKFSSTGPGVPYAVHTINNHQFQDDDPPQTIDLNTVQQWKVENYAQAISHPFHIHINPFQIAEVFDPNVKVVLANGRLGPKYVFFNNPAPDPAQCYWDPTRPDTWHDCKNAPPPQISHGVWWDVFPIPSGLGATDANGNPIVDSNNQQIVAPGYFRMRSRFVDFYGAYVLHCHILAHEDRGMMAKVVVGPPWPQANSLHHH